VVVVARVVVLGGGMIGLCTGMLLADQGSDVTVLERDDAPVPGSPDEAWQAWDRPGVAQFRQPHHLHSAGAQILESQLPDVWESLAQAQLARFSSLDIMPPFITDRSSRDGDERFVTLTGRRPVLEYAVASVARKRLDIRRGTAVAGLLTGAPAAPGTPHVTGVQLANGTDLPADLVVDAMGRRSAMPAWLTAIGAQPPEEEAEDSGFIYYTRFFRPADGGSVPPYKAGLLTHFECFSLLTLPGDADTWSVTVYLASGDQALKGLRDPGPWTALVEACPMHAHLLQGEPITDVLPIGGVVDRCRRFVVAGTPVVTGMVTVGDAWGCTNPSLGRGVTMGLMHAAGTAGVIREHLGDPLALALAHDEMTQATVTPWYQNTIQLDRARRAQLHAAATGEPTARVTGERVSAVPASAPDSADPAARLRRALPVAMLYDADIFRAFAEIVSLLALPQEVLSRPGMAERIMAVAGEHEEVVIPGPSRADVLNILNGQGNGQGGQGRPA
jgi:2-polyprenyl-6-methoxyphenol hydroxylase-like FAD-dependent oxidoreductase